uniref:Secreted protein n=1 Tax=Micrurus lemniscatus lemniscatus TaxID=129467 RepID=A0A2D4HWM6_MICLE
MKAWKGCFMISKALLVVVRRGTASGSCNHGLSAWQPVRPVPHAHLPPFAIFSAGFPRKPMGKTAGKIASYCHLTKDFPTLHPPVMVESSVGCRNKAGLFRSELGFFSPASLPCMGSCLLSCRLSWRLSSALQVIKCPASY